MNAVLKFCCSISFCVDLSFAVQVQAQGSVFQVADLNTGANGLASGGIGEFDRATGFDGKTFFTMQTQDSGKELWVSDGTALGTRLFSDICPGRCSGMSGFPAPEFYVEGNNMYFQANDGVHGFELWRLAAGSTAPTFVADLNPGVNGSGPAGFVRENFLINATVVNRTYFSATRDDIGRELWRLNNGTAPTATLELDVRPGASSSSPRRIQSCATSQICFIANSEFNGDDIKLLNYASATAVPTGFSVIGDFPTGQVFVNDLLTLASTTYFYVRTLTSSTEQLRVFGNSAASSTALDSGNNFGPLTINVPLFRMFYKSGNALRVSNGTVAGTSTVSTAAPGTIFSVGNRVLFVGLNTGAGRELFSSDGTTAGTAMLKELVGGSAGIDDSSILTQFKKSANGARVFLSFQNPSVGNDTQLWVSDATAAGTVEISGNQISDPGGRLFILPSAVQNAILGYELQLGASGEPFFANGNNGGTVALGNFVSDIGDSFPSALATVNQRLILNATIDGVSATRTMPVNTSSPVQDFLGVNRMFDLHFGQLWFENSLDLAFSDGTVSGTTILDNINPSVSHPSCLVERGEFVYFPVNVGTSVADIFKSDGTAGGTTRVTNLALNGGGLDTFCFKGEHRKIAALGDKILFEASNGSSGLELFALGANDAASLVLDINAGSGDSRIGGMTTLTDRGALPDLVVFKANEGIFGEEIWVSGGTAQSTQRLSDINPGAGNANPQDFLSIGNKVFFTAFAPATGRELYVSDGTAAGTLRVVDLFAGFGSGIVRELLGVARGKVYFNGLSSTAPNCILFESDGTSAGTQCAYDASTITLSGLGQSFAVTASGALVFSATRIAPINEGEEIRVLFNRQLLNVSGADVAPGHIGSAPANFLADGDSVFFMADDGATGFELWKLNLPNLDALFTNGFE